MSARDDFEIIKVTCLNIEGGEYSNPVVTAAFNRLFTPRPLKQIFDDGFRHCMAWNTATPDIQARYFDLRHNEANDFNGTWRHYLAIPILTPEDMGEG